VSAKAHQLFGQALDLPEGQRERWLRVQCGEDHALFAAVSGLLRADAAASLLDGDVAELAEPLVTGIVDREAGNSAQHVGAHFGPYIVRQLLGRGGMGSVWLAERDDGGFQQRVAIKLMASALPSDEALQRFAQERQILAKLQHPNIARVLDGGSVEGAPWFAMDYVEGIALDEYAKRHALPIEEKLRLFCKVVNAVQFAHQNLVVHRDLKPSNILVDAGSDPHLLDFGVAKLLDEGIELTASRAPLSMAYAAPEQIVGKTITTATDIYSLGVILYQLLSGSRPYKNKGNGTLALMQAITDTDPEPPSRVASTQTTRDSRRLRGDLDTIVLKCLSRDPLRRYASAQALSDDIDAFLRQMPIRARPESWHYRAGKFARRHPLGVALGVLALSAVLGLSIYSTLKAREAELERIATAKQADRATAVQDFLIGIFEQQRPDATLGASISAKDLLDRAEQKLASGAKLNADTRAVLLDTLSRLRYDLSDFEAALRLTEEAVRHAGASFGETSAQYAQALVQRSDALQQVGRSDEAVVDCQRAIPLLRNAGLAVPEMVSALLNCAAMLRNDGRVDEARRWVDEAGELVAMASPADPKLVRSMLRARSRLAHARSEHALAVELLSELIGLLRADPNIAPSDLATALHSRAASNKPLGNTRAAIDDYREALALHHKVFGPKHFLSIETQSSLATVLYEVGESVEAERLQQEALVLARETLGSDNPTLAFTLSDAAIQAFMRRDFAGAAALLEEAIAVNTRAFGPLHRDSLALLNNLSSIHRKLGRYDEARANANEVLARTQSDDKTDRLQQRQAHARLAMIAEATGDSVELQRQAQWILTALRSTKAVEVAEEPEALAFLAVAQMMQSQRAAAEQTAALLETAARKAFEADTAQRALYLSYVCFIAMESEDASRAIELSAEVLGEAAVDAASWSRFALLQAAIVRLRALKQLGRDEEALPWRLALAERRKTATADESLLWQSVELLLPP